MRLVRRIGLTDAPRDYQKGALPFGTQSVKHLVWVLVFGLFPMLGFSQDGYPVAWEFNVESVDDLTYRVEFTATIDQPYHIYSQDGTGGGLGMPTQFVFEEAPNLMLVDAVEEKGLGPKGKLPYYSRGVTFSQLVQLKENKETTLVGKIKFMACTKQMCLLPATKEFQISLKK